jgi:peroxiredoxin
MPATKRFNVVDAALVVLALVTVTFAALSYLRPRTVVTDPAGASLVGTRLSGIDVRDAQSNTRKFEFVGQPGRVLVLAYRSDCPFCEQNSVNWRSLVARVQRRGRIVTLSPDSVAKAGEWVRRHNVRVDEDLIPVDFPGVMQSWHLVGVPTTLVVEPGGKVIFSKVGVLSQPQVDSIAAFFVN